MLEVLYVTPMITLGEIKIVIVLQPAGQESH
jgi:hypothetical protein